MRLARLLLPLFVLALAAGCGGTTDPSKSPSASERAKRVDAALKWAKCMRKHGYDVPDPKFDADGNMQIRVAASGAGAKSLSTMGPGDKACAKYMRRGTGEHAPSAADQKKMQDRALAFARCMRAHGIDMPDPQFSDGGLRIIAPRPASDPVFRRAQQACQSLMGPVGPKSGGATAFGGPNP